MQKLKPMIARFIVLSVFMIVSCSPCDENLVVEPPVSLSISCYENSKEKQCVRRQELGDTYTMPSSIQYPEEARINGIEGIVVIGFNVDTYGIPIDLEIIEGIGYGCDEEAIKYIKRLNFTPAKNECGEGVIAYMTDEVEFDLQ